MSLSEIVEKRNRKDAVLQMLGRYSKDWERIDQEVLDGLAPALGALEGICEIPLMDDGDNQVYVLPFSAELFARDGQAFETEWDFYAGLRTVIELNHPNYTEVSCEGYAGLSVPSADNPIERIILEWPAQIYLRPVWIPNTLQTGKPVSIAHYTPTHKKGHRFIIPVTRSAIQKNEIRLNSRSREEFPGYQEPFTICYEGGSVPLLTHVTSASCATKGSYAGKAICKNISALYSSLGIKDAPSAELEFTVVQPATIYHVRS